MTLGRHREYESGLYRDDIRIKVEGFRVSGLTV